MEVCNSVYVCVYLFMNILFCSLFCCLHMSQVLFDWSLNFSWFLLSTCCFTFASLPVYECVFVQGIFKRVINFWCLTVNILKLITTQAECTRCLFKRFIWSGRWSRIAMLIIIGEKNCFFFWGFRLTIQIKKIWWKMKILNWAN